MTTSTDRITISTLLSQTKDEFISSLGSIYEHSPWVAERLFDSLSSSPSSPPPITSLRDLILSMKRIVDSSTREEKLALLRAHPELGVASSSSSSTDLTTSSQVEQSRAGLDTLTPDEIASFHKWNESYKTTFGFPFILAVRHATKYTVLSAMNGRRRHSPEVEFAVAVAQVHKIARMRLLAAIDGGEPKGFLTCHVLDTANGCPARDMRVRLYRLDGDRQRELVDEFRTNEDGRLPGGPALKGAAFEVGVYEWVFYVGDYFAGTTARVDGVPFLDEVPIRFGIDDPEEHYHVPLLVSPFSFSTYRGS